LFDSLLAELIGGENGERHQPNTDPGTRATRSGLLFTIASRGIGATPR
jgi:hypothetical protein